MVSAISKRKALVSLTICTLGTVKMWNANTYRLEKTLNYGMERVWTVAYLKGSNVLCLGYDEGTVMIKMGRDEPAMSMDPNGKLVWAKHNEVQMVHNKIHIISNKR